MKSCIISVTILLGAYSLQSCKKNSESIPIPVINQDTLTFGWTKKSVIGEYQLHDIFFNSSTTGYLTASRIYKTVDGGNSWIPVSPNYTFPYNISVTPDNKVFATTQVNLIYKSIDGGLSFSSINISTEPLDIFFVDNTNGYCATPDGLYHTNDGGVNWAKINTTGLPLMGYSGYNASLFCINNNAGWISAVNGIYRSSGSLGSWQLASTSGGIPFNFCAIHAASANIIYAANYYGEIFKSIDGGATFTFTKKLELDGGGFTDIHFINDLLGFACSGRHVFKTTDGGVTWMKVVSIGEGVLGEMHFTDADHGWVVGDSSPWIEGFVLTLRK